MITAGEAKNSLLHVRLNKFGTTIISKRIKNSFHRIQLYLDKAEDRKMLSLVQTGPRTILDVGCGQGRYLIPLVKMGHKVTGVDVSPIQVEALAKQGYTALLANSFERSDTVFDCIIMSHVLEHIPPNNLIKFIDLYLDKLIKNGTLLIATPLMHPGFFDDYDHIRPYTPSAIATLYSEWPQQQEKPRHRLLLKEVWIRKSPVALRSYPGQHVLLRRLISIGNILLLLALILTGHILCRRTGWIGRFEKLD